MKKDGFELAHTQHELAGAKPVKSGDGCVEISTEGEFAIIKGENFEYKFNMHYGCIEKLDNLLESRLKLGIWRAPTDNDMVVKLDWYKEKYDKMYSKVYETEILDNTITVKGALSSVSRSKFFTYTAEYTFFQDGRIDVVLDGDFDTSRAFLPRLGFEAETKEKNFEYFGYGPYESYVDMHHGSKIGMYKSDASSEYVNYIKPQEHGNHYDTKYLRLGDFEFIAPNGFEFAVSEYSAPELEKKAHNYELVKSKHTHFRIDYKNSGIGSHSCSLPLADKYKMNDDKVHFQFSVINRNLKEVK